MTDSYTDHAVAGQPSGKLGCSRLWSQLLLITTSVLLRDVRSYYTELAICIHSRGMCVTPRPNRRAASAEASSHTSCHSSRVAGLTGGARTHILYFSQCQNKTSRHISKVQQNNSGATNTRLAESSHVQLHSWQKKKKKKKMLRLACFTIGGDVNAD